MNRIQSNCHLFLKLFLKRNLFFFCALVFGAQETSFPGNHEKAAWNEHWVKANQLKLAKHPQWLRLLQVPTGCSDCKSRVDGGPFFASDSKQWSAEKELKETLRLFYHAEKKTWFLKKDTLVQHAQERWPARLRFLKTHLDLNDLPSVQVESWKRFEKELRLESLTFVFASAYLNNPVSSLGHTFLRMNLEEFKGKSALLQKALTYGANSPDFDLLYPIKGIFGYYKAGFQLMPYFVSTQQYIHREYRDLWEYDLKLSSDEKQRFVEYLWEVMGAEWDYWFFDENCSFVLQSFLEVVYQKDLGLTESWIVLPQEALKKIHSNLYVQSERQRLSDQKEFSKSLSKLSKWEESQAKKWVSRGKPDSLSWLKLRAKYPSQTANALRAALHYAHIKQKKDSSFWLKRYRLLLTKVAELDPEKESTAGEKSPIERSPFQGRSSSLLSFSFARQADGWSLGGDWSWVSQKFKDGFYGSTPYGDLEFMSIETKWDFGNQDSLKTGWEVLDRLGERWTLLHLRSLSEGIGFESPLSWEFGMFVNNESPKEPINFEIESAVGKSEKVKSILFYGLGGFRVRFGKKWRMGSSLAPYAEMGSLYAITESYRASISVMAEQELLGGEKRRWELNALFHRSIQKNLGITLAGQWKTDDFWKLELETQWSY